MEVNNCTDINGVVLNELKFNLDGTVVGLIISDDVEYSNNLSYECCTVNGFTFDPNDTKCYWAPSCLNGSGYNIVLDPTDNTGAFFQVDEIEQKICHLELDFKFLLKVDASNIQVNGLKEFLETIKLSVNIEKIIYDENLPIPNNLEKVATKELFNVVNIVEYLTNNDNTGIYLTDSNTNRLNYESVKFNFISDLGDDSNVLNDQSLNSDWFNFKMVIDDSKILEAIFNERIKFSIVGNELRNFSIILDDVKLNRVCDVPIIEPAFDEECPSFNLKRVIDNKKSWVKNDETEIRDFDLSRRETKYSINNERLSINSKEIDLAINPSKAIENDISQAILNNECILNSKDGCIVNTHECVDLRPLITTEIFNSEELSEILIDVKNRKVINSYPTLDLLFHRYLNVDEHCGSGTTTNALTSDSINNFVDLIGNYWVDLIEQLVPATTIWGSSYIHSSVNNFNGNSGNGINKFVYKKGSLLFCNSVSHEVTSPVTNGVINNEVIIEDITDNDTTTSICNKIYSKQINYGSEFIGTVNILGVGEAPVSGDTISIMETIKDSCNLYEKY